MIDPKVGDFYRTLESSSSIYRIVLLARNLDEPERRFVILEQLFESPSHPKGTFWAIELQDFYEKQVLKDEEFISENKYRKGAELQKFVLMQNFIYDEK